MTNFSRFSRHLKYQLRHCVSFPKLTYPWQSLCFLSSSLSRYLLHVFYFVSISCIGFLVLKPLQARTETSGPDSFTPRSLDLFFTSVSAATVSSMSTVEMEVFSNAQLIVLTVLMFLGGEVFISMVGLHLKQRRLKKVVSDDHAELEKIPEIAMQNPDYIRYRSIRLLGFFVLAYLVGILVLGIALVSIYLTFVSSTARHVLKQKGLKTLTFSVFTTVSSFVNCGFVPTNENMIVFSKNSGLLLLLIPQLLMGNTLLPSCLRFCLWVFGKFTKREEIGYLLNTREITYDDHLLPKLHSWLLFVTVLGFIGVQFVMFCAVEWYDEPLRGLSAYEKIVGILFQCVNSRHAGETIVDLSAIGPAMLVIFVVMMYLPPYTSFLPVNEEEDYEVVERSKKKRIRAKFLENLILSQLSYLAIFIILVCITERKKMKEDPLNFSVLNIVVEVISAYGNVGFTTGYSCKRQLTQQVDCKDKWFGFSGKWSDEGKTILILVMIFGRLKKFNMNGGKGWKLL